MKIITQTGYRNRDMLITELQVLQESMLDLQLAHEELKKELRSETTRMEMYQSWYREEGLRVQIIQAKLVTAKVLLLSGTDEEAKLLAANSL